MSRTPKAPKTRFPRGIFVALTTLGVMLAGAAPAAARPSEPSAIPVEAQVAYARTGSTEVKWSASKVDKWRTSTAGKSLAAEYGTVAVECWTLSVWVAAYNNLDMTIYRFYNENDWCGDSSTGKVIYTAAATPWVTTYIFGWNYEGLHSQSSSGGNGYTSWTKETRGKMCFISAFSCIQETYPWIEAWHRWDGDYATDGSGV